MSTTIVKASSMKTIEIDEDQVSYEIAIAKAQIHQVACELTNPELEFGASVRLTIQQREMEAYLQGILFALGEAGPRENFLDPEI